MDTIQDGAIVIAVVQAIKNLLPDKVSGIVTIIVAGVVGGVLAFIRNTDVTTGVFGGLAAAGVITTASRIGK